MRTPRTPTPTRRGTTTLIGHGWLKEAPKNVWPHGWDIKSRSALRKCVFLPVPPEARAFIDALPPPKPFPAAPQPVYGARPATPVPRRSDPQKNARVFEAVSPEEVQAKQRQKLYAEAQRVVIDQSKTSARPWYEDPIAMGTLLLMMPPMGLAILWTSKRYSSDARWALTVMTGLMMCLGTAVIVAVTALAQR